MQENEVLSTTSEKKGTDFQVKAIKQNGNGSRLNQTNNNVFVF